MPRVLFLCTGNAARSQMAEALLRHLGGIAFDVHSAGTNPKGVHPLTVRVMAEAGIDVSGQTSKGIDRYASESWDYVITVCDRAAESCPVFPGDAVRLHWPIPDPAAALGVSEEERLAAFRAARAAIAKHVREFLTRRTRTRVL